MKDSSGFHRTSGDFSAISNVIWNEATFPADTGIFQSVVGAFLQRVCLPRERGDLSACTGISPPARKSSPRERGCFSVLPESKIPETVFPARAGIFPSQEAQKFKPLSLPRVCGDFSV